MYDFFGGWLHASGDAIKICQITENVFRRFIQSTPHPVVNKMVISGLRNINNIYSPFASLSQNSLNNNILQLTSVVLRVYVHHQNTHLNQIKNRVKRRANQSGRGGDAFIWRTKSLHTEAFSK